MARCMNCGTDFDCDGCEGAAPTEPGIIQLCPACADSFGEDDKFEPWPLGCPDPDEGDR